MKLSSLGAAGEFTCNDAETVLHHSKPDTSTSDLGQNLPIVAIRGRSAFAATAEVTADVRNRRRVPYPEVLLRGQPALSELGALFQFEVRSSNLCAEGLSRIPSANHPAGCFAAASAASREEYTPPE